ncbi:peptidoglycan DD-metalloendopeptidase family protein [Flavobacterium sp. Sd200]|uniref:murein hydrolase activator EnvC family protein n=1 Tax=Flavobacterium sp. Sd200 TaxID=2692211 RepID=UPI00136ED8C4|nr:peptidoglycan DD-metalloendopeptidase family protein [Flavobacterium sp. Sd200]MXN92623.1 peptidoglycan DD-metalloendopeptidase family protein [Flavobacterium sp. Sd200]
MTRFFLTILLIATGFIAKAQGGAEQKKLEDRKAQIQKEILELNNRIKDESSKEKSVLAKIEDGRAKIKLNERLLYTTNKQALLINDEIYVNQVKTNKLKAELKVLKEDYANMLVRAYKTRSDQSRIMFLLSSQGFLQAYKRLQYMKQYASFRKIQGDEIKSKMAELDTLLKKLTVQKQEKVRLLTEIDNAKDVLEKEKREQEDLVRSIQKDKKKLAADITRKKKESREIQRKIDAMIRAAIAAANKKTAKKASESKATTAAAAKASTTKITLTKEGKIVSDNFKANKGRLPWPVEKGYISTGYGTQPHPVMKNLEIHNSGVDITTEPGTNVRAVFGGEVMSVQVIQGTRNKIVYLQHGDFITVYYNLATVNVSSGDKVSLKQSIGTAAANPTTGNSVIKFLVLQNTTYLNPSTWITK